MTAQNQLLREALAATEAVSALITHQYTGTSISMTDLQIASDLCDAVSPKIRAALAQPAPSGEPVAGDEPETPILRALDHLAKGRFVSLDEAVAAANAALIFYRGRTALKANTAPQAPSVPDDVRKDAALSIAMDALEEIALAGMSGTGQESEEAMRDWHARQAWKFIGIAARAKSKIDAAIAPAKQGGV